MNKTLKAMMAEALGKQLLERRIEGQANKNLVLASLVAHLLCLQCSLPTHHYPMTVPNDLMIFIQTLNINKSKSKAKSLFYYSKSQCLFVCSCQVVKAYPLLSCKLTLIYRYKQAGNFVSKR